jgi:hypothetical protein
LRIIFNARDDALRVKRAATPMIQTNDSRSSNVKAEWRVAEGEGLALVVSLMRSITESLISETTLF